MKILLSALCFLAAYVASAQSGTLSGKIIDAETKEPLIGATVLIENTTLGGITDLNGVFRIKNAPVGNQQIKIKYVGYDDLVKDVSIAEGQPTVMPDITMQLNSIGLTQIEVFANVVETDRKTPIAVSTVNEVQIDEQLGGMQMPEIMNSAPGVYATIGDGSYGDAYVNIRGFGQEEVLFMINGVPTNDMENGIMYWSNFAGLSEVTKNMQVQRGLGASKLGVNSVGGTMNIITTPSDRRKGGKAEITFANNNSFNNRYSLTLNSGLLKGGWAFTFQGSRTTGEGIRPGTYVNSYAYFLTASKKINDQHTLLFTGFGVPTDRGRAWSTNTDTYKRYDDYYYNEAMGYYRGQKYNVSQNKAHKPELTLMHLWTPSERMTITTSVYASIARVYGTSILRAQNISELPLTTDGLQNLDSMSLLNRRNIQTIQNPYGQPLNSSITGAQSKYILEARYNNHNWYGVISNINYQLTPTTSLVAGVDLRNYRASHFARVKDLLGGEFWYDVDRYTGEDNNILMPRHVARKGDKIRFDYDGVVRWASVFGQLEKTIDKLDVFASVNLSRVQMYRVGNMWSGVQDTDFYNVYIYNSLGESDKRIYNNYNAKAGINYSIDGRNNVFVNGGVFTRAPFLQNAFEQPNYGNDYLVGMKNEDIHAVEAGYRYRTGKFRANVDVYFTEWKNKAFVNTSTTDFANPNTGLRQAVTGIAAQHKGIEIDATYEPIQGLELTASYSKGDWEWTNDGMVTFADESGAVTQTVHIYTNGLKVGNTAQTTAFIGAHYKGIKDTYFGARFNYFGDLYEMFDPAERITGYKPVRKLPDYTILDVYGGYFFTIGEIRSRAGFNIHNLLDGRFIRRSDERFGTQEVYGYPVNYSANLTVYFN